MALSWALDGTALVVLTEDSELVFLDCRKMKPYKKFHCHDRVETVQWGPTQSLLTVGVDDGTMRVVPASKPDHPLWRLPAHSGTITNLTYSRSYKYLAAAGYESMVTLWDMDDVICVRTFSRPDQTVRSVDFSHDAKWLAYSCEDNSGTIEVVSVQTGELAVALNLRQVSSCLAWCPTAPVLAFTGEELKDYSAVTIWAPPKS